MNEFRVEARAANEGREGLKGNDTAMGLIGKEDKFDFESKFWRELIVRDLRERNPGFADAVESMEMSIEV